MYRISRGSDYTTGTFSTFAVKNCSVTEVSHICVGTKHGREIMAGDLFDFINGLDDEEEVVNSFENLEHFTGDSYLWYITYGGTEPPSLEELNIRKVYVISKFRKEFGWKMIGLAKRKIAPDENIREKNRELKRIVTSAILWHIKYISEIGWAEVSDKLEYYFSKALSFYDIIDPYDIKENEIFSGVSIDLDQFHYYRPLCTSKKPVSKIAYGKITF